MENDLYRAAAKLACTPELGSFLRGLMFRINWQKLRYLFLAGLFGLVFLSGGMGGVVVDRLLLAHAAAPTTTAANATPDTSLITQAWNLINQFYVDRPAVTSEKLTYGAISGMVDALGDTGHSRFMSPQTVKEEHNAMQGQFEGVGLEVNSKDGQVVIVAPIDGAPAQKAGLHSGQVIQKVNGGDLTGLPLNQVIDKILGPAGTQVTLTIFDPVSGQTQDFTLTRARITLTNVSWAFLPGTNIADIDIANFSNGVDRTLIKDLQEIQLQHPSGIILDLRNDPGGLLDQAVAVASQFKGDGDVMEEKDAQGRITQLSVKPGGLATQTPLVVLINNGTASAAEIVTAALQDGHRATAVGETTFGTGTVLDQFNLPDGSALLLATQEWLTPSGASFWHKGIAPDIQLAMPVSTQPLSPGQISQMTADQLKSSQDLQLLKAIDLLNLSKANAPTP